MAEVHTYLHCGGVFPTSVPWSRGIIITAKVMDVVIRGPYEAIQDTFFRCASVSVPVLRFFRYYDLFEYERQG